MPLSTLSFPHWDPRRYLGHSEFECSLIKRIHSTITPTDCSRGFIGRARSVLENTRRFIKLQSSPLTVRVHVYSDGCDDKGDIFQEAKAVYLLRPGGSLNDLSKFGVFVADISISTNHRLAINYKDGLWLCAASFETPKISVVRFNVYSKIRNTLLCKSLGSVWFFFFFFLK